MDHTDKQRMDGIDQIRDCVSGISSEENPFLYYLPDLLVSATFLSIDPSQALLFTKVATLHDHSPLIIDALRILNQMVNPKDGSVYPPGPQMFYNNSNFFWKELGTHTTSAEAILHIINKTTFTLSLENTT